MHTFKLPINLDHISTYPFGTTAIVSWGWVWNEAIIGLEWGYCRLGVGCCGLGWSCQLFSESSFMCECLVHYTCTFGLLL